ncbi:MAG: GerW family sporulation protein [Lachnospiraceae bacterium]|nr:GerW family sporulation protein [Lachnospiraceae bacterium]MBQ6311810.1 GerW family sporulation protein [Lachnospiraceae bacterium]MBQ6353712.1 GerW family sporulation protein [Lachnospiraceae bacterium]
MSNNKDNNGNKNGFTGAVRSMFDGIDHVVSSKTVVGDPIYVDGMTLIPLMEVSFAMGTGVLAQDSRGKKSGGVGAKMIPSSILVIQNGKTRLVNIKKQDTITKIMDLVPDIFDRIDARSHPITEDEISETLDRALEDGEDVIEE